MELEKKFEVTTNQLGNERSMLKEQERVNQELESEVARLKNEVRIGKQQLESYRVAHEGTVNNLELELESLKGQLASAERRES